MKTVPSDRIWFNGELIPWDQAQVHILAHVIHYGSGVFEGLRAYKGENGTAVVGLPAHMQRLRNSARIVGMDLPYEVDTLCQAVLDTIRANKQEACYIRPFAFRGYGELGVDPRGCPIEVAVASFPWGAYMGGEALSEGVDVGVASWRRMAPDTHPAMAKTTGNYINSQMVVVEAKRHGYSEGIVLDTTGFVSEGSGENIFLVMKDQIFTPSLGSCILPGITRDYALQLARDFGIEVTRGRIPREMLYTADELFFTGTAAEVTPIRSVDGMKIGNGGRGPVTEKIQTAYFDIIEGRTEDRHGWMTPVYES